MNKIESVSTHVGKRGNANMLTGIAVGIGTFIFVTGLFIIILDKFANTGVSATANTAIQFGITNLGSTGLLGWIGAVIAMLVGVYFLSSFLGGKGYN